VPCSRAFARCADEPDATLTVAELGTGYYSKVAGKLAEDEEGADASELNALTKTIIEQGVTYFNYYLGVGGTNRDWAAKGVTTTYDFAAPLREGGGLWDKYYEVRAIGALLGMFGPMLTRAEPRAAGVHSTHPDLSATQRTNGDAALVFLRANTEAEHHFRLSIHDPAGSGIFNIPRQGDLTLGPRAMKILPVLIPIPDGQLR